MEITRQVELAGQRIAGRVRLTPLERSPVLEESHGGAVWLKLDNQQLTGSFKLRGATNKMLVLDSVDRARGVVAASSGNHGAAVACAAHAVGCPATVYVPTGAVESKLDAIRAWGGKVRLHGDDCVHAEAEARRFAAETGAPYLSPYNDPAIIAGQGTVGLEIATQLGDDVDSASALDAVFITLGGGGLLAGVGGYLKSRWPELRVVACSPKNSCVMHASIEAGHILEMESLPTLSDGSAGGVEPESITFPLCRDLVDESLLLDEKEIAEALRLIVGTHHTLIEGAAATAVAGYLAARERYAGAHVAIVLCGANVDRARLKEVL